MARKIPDKFSAESIRRFESKFDKTPDQCWEWKARLAKRGGYGEATLDKYHSTSHRLSYLIYKGKIPCGLHVCHSCDNPSCVNPDHLFLGTNQENIMDSVNKGRRFRKAFKEDRYLIKALYILGVKRIDLARKFSLNPITIDRITHA